MSQELKLFLLGRPQIIEGDNPVLIFHKAQALFYYLAVTGHPQQRTALLHFLWSQIPESHRKNNLRVTLSYLRKRFGAYLSINRHTVSFNQNARHGLDVEVLKKTLQSTPKTIEQLEEATKLYQGPFLEGFEVPEEKEFEAWVAETRLHLQNLIVQALHTLALRYEEHGRYAEGIEAVNRLLALQPWREESHQLLMILLACSGQRSAALEQYDICRNILEEYKRTPSGELVKLREEILTGKLGQLQRIGGGVHELGGYINLTSQRQVEEPKQMTVMYCHWHPVGSPTSQAPETWYTLQQYCQENFFKTIQESKGKIIYQCNGSLLVAFEGEDSPEHNAQRAIETGLAMLEIFETSKSVTTHKLSLGIHTGRVLVENVTVGQQCYMTLIGQPLEIAQDLARRATPNALLISWVTYSLVKEIFLCQRLNSNNSDQAVYEVQSEKVKIRA